MNLVVQTAPETEPLTISEVLFHARFDESSAQMHAYIDTLIASARRAAEQEIGRSLITQTLDAYFDYLPAEIRLRPLQSVVSITYVDSQGATQTLASDQYIVDAVSKPARIGPAYGVTWPSVRPQINAVKVRFIAGYGDAQDVPEGIKLWMLQRIKHVLDNPGVMTGGNFNAVEFPRTYVDGLLDPERVYGL